MFDELMSIIQWDGYISEADSSRFIEIVDEMYSHDWKCEVSEERLALALG